MSGDVLRTPQGQVRLGWRLSLFAFLLVGLASVLARSLPPTMLWSSVALLVAALVAGWTLLALDGHPPAALGFALRRGAFSAALLGFALGGTVLVLGVLFIVAAGGIRWSAESGSPGAYLSSGAAALGVLAVPAAAEEALLRGYLLQGLSEAWGPAVALLLTSAAFGLLHFGNPQGNWMGVANTATAGLFLGGLYLRTGSLWWPSGAHLGWNWAEGFLLDLPVSGIDVADAPWLEGRAVGPEFLSGGAFGPEGSILVTGVAAGAAAWVWGTRHLSPAPEAALVSPLARLRRRPAWVPARCP